MKKQKIQITVPGVKGKFQSEFIFFNQTDKKMLKKMFTDWVNLCKQSLAIGSTRIINFLFIKFR